MVVLINYTVHVLSQVVSHKSACSVIGACEYGVMRTSRQERSLYPEPGCIYYGRHYKSIFTSLVVYSFKNIMIFHSSFFLIFFLFRSLHFSSHKSKTTFILLLLLLLLL